MVACAEGEDEGGVGDGRDEATNDEKKHDDFLDQGFVGSLLRGS
jgi:hypothetical protein